MAGRPSKSFVGNQLLTTFHGRAWNGLHMPSMSRSTTPTVMSCGSSLPITRRFANLPEFPPFRVPDALGEVTGWRAWRVVIDGDIRLASVDVGRTLWHPGGFATARCVRGVVHDAPDVACTCGFYAVRTREYLVGLGIHYRSATDHPVVIGEVALSGKVILASRGFRAERARPLRLKVPHELWRLANRLDEAYGPNGVRVELDNTVRRVTSTEDVEAADSFGHVGYGQRGAMYLEPRHPRIDL